MQYSPSAITLLALEIRLPDIARGFNNTLLFSTLLNMWPQYFGYVISFLVIGSFWMAHHRKFRFITRLDNRLLQLNLLLLTAVRLRPFSQFGNQRFRKIAQPRFFMHLS